MNQHQPFLSERAGLMFSVQADSFMLAYSSSTPPSQGAPSMRSGLSSPITHSSAPDLVFMHSSPSYIRETQSAGMSSLRSFQNILFACSLVGAAAKYLGARQSLSSARLTTSLRFASSVFPLLLPARTTANLLFSFEAPSDPLPVYGHSKPLNLLSCLFETFMVSAAPYGV